jgi:hypothetical protein
VGRTNERYLGIDPGLSKTGICVCTKTRSGVLRIEYLCVIHTSPKETLQARFKHIREEIAKVIGDYDVSYVICEAYEVQTYHKPLKCSVSMSQLIAEISEEIYRLRRPFMLSSPRNKRGYQTDSFSEDAQKKLMAVAKTNREHVLDAYIHVYHQIIKKGR